MRRTTKVKRKLPRTGAKKRRVLRAWLRAARNGARFFLLLAVSFLISGSVMPYLNIGGVTPNLLFAVVGVITQRQRVCPLRFVRRHEHAFV